MGNEEEKENKYYQEKIVEMINKIRDPIFLKFIYNLLQSFKKKWGIFMIE